MKAGIFAFLLLFAFFSPLSAMEKISLEDDFGDERFQRYSAFLIDEKLTLNMNRLLSASNPNHRLSRPSLYPQAFPFPTASDDEIGIKFSPQDRYRVGQHPYPKGWASLASMTQLLFLAVEITTKCRVCASPSDSALDAAPQTTPFYNRLPNSSNPLSYSPQDVRP